MMFVKKKLIIDFISPHIWYNMQDNKHIHTLFSLCFLYIIWGISDPVLMYRIYSICMIDPTIMYSTITDTIQQNPGIWLPSWVTSVVIWLTHSVTDRRRFNALRAPAAPRATECTRQSFWRYKTAKDAPYFQDHTRRVNEGAVRIARAVLQNKFPSKRAWGGIWLSLWWLLSEVFVWCSCCWRRLPTMSQPACNSATHDLNWCT